MSPDMWVAVALLLFALVWGGIYTAAWAADRQINEQRRAYVNARNTHRKARNTR